MNLKAMDITISSTVDLVARALRTAIFKGDIKPGEQIREVAVAQRLGVSRNTVREALRILTADGLTVYSPNKGVMVRSLSAAEVEDIFRARAVLEKEAARAAVSAPPEAVEELSKAMDLYAAAAAGGDLPEAANSHVEFHAALVALTGSSRLADAERSLMQELQILIAAIDTSSDDLPLEVEKHRRLLEHFRKRDFEAAIRTIEEDLAHAKSFILRSAD